MSVQLAWGVELESDECGISVAPLASLGQDSHVSWPRQLMCLGCIIQGFLPSHISLGQNQWGDTRFERPSSFPMPFSVSKTEMLGIVWHTSWQSFNLNRAVLWRIQDAWRFANISNNFACLVSTNQMLEIVWKEYWQSLRLKPCSGCKRSFKVSSNFEIREIGYLF